MYDLRLASPRYPGSISIKIPARATGNQVYDLLSRYLSDRGQYVTASDLTIIEVAKAIPHDDVPLDVQYLTTRLGPLNFIVSTRPGSSPPSSSSGVSFRRTVQYFSPGLGSYDLRFDHPHVSSEEIYETLSQSAGVDSGRLHIADTISQILPHAGAEVDVERLPDRIFFAVAPEEDRVITKR